MKTVVVSEELHEFLTKSGRKRESYDEIIKRLIGFDEEKEVKEKK